MSARVIKWALLAVVLSVIFVFLWVLEAENFLPSVTSPPSPGTAESTAVQAPPVLPELQPAPPAEAGDAATTPPGTSVAPTPAVAPEAVLAPEQEALQTAEPALRPSHAAEKAEQQAGAPLPDTPAPGADPGTEEITEKAPDSTQESALDPAEDVIKGTLSKGDTVSKLLEPHADAGAVQEIITATRRVFPLTSFRAGQPYVLVCDVQSGSVKRFEYEIDQKRRLVVEGQEGSAQPVARVEAIEYDTELALVVGRIDDNLFQAVADMGESPQLALLIANLFGWEINFIRDLKEGDSFSILFEKLYREGQFRGYGRTLGATFTNKGKTYEAFLFHDSRGQEHHYNIRGENLKKTLLQAPLSFTRVTSGYTKSRKHPIFGDHRAHYGVDYGAPTGTPVKAVGDGAVSLRGWAGGYGNQVVVKHSAGLESMYSHLSGFARGIAVGSRVRQGQVIAYVGSTGNSTGPHLDFRLKQNGTFVNPTKAVNPRSEAVGKPQMAGFARRMELVRGFMNGTRPVTSYTPDMVVAPKVSSPPVKEPEEAKPVVKKKKRKS